MEIKSLELLLAQLKPLLITVVVTLGAVACVAMLPSGGCTRASAANRGLLACREIFLARLMPGDAGLPEAAVTEAVREREGCERGVLATIGREAPDGSAPALAGPSPIARASTVEQVLRPGGQSDGSAAPPAVAAAVAPDGAAASGEASRPPATRLPGETPRPALLQTSAAPPATASSPAKR